MFLLPVPEEVETVENIDFHINVERWSSIYKEIDFEDNGEKISFYRTSSCVNSLRIFRNDGRSWNILLDILATQLNFIVKKR
jgi:hypothetical protein